ncbi:MAG: hypothetical protein SynsKO_24170 [Synoicihabitans sp.]
MLRPNALSSHRIFVVSLVALGGLAITIALWHYADRLQETDIANEFQHRANNKARVAREHISAFPEMMMHLRSIASFNQPVFRAMLAESFRDLTERHPSISILEWVH